MLLCKHPEAFSEFFRFFHAVLQIEHFTQPGILNIISQMRRRYQKDFDAVILLVMDIAPHLFQKYPHLTHDIQGIQAELLFHVVGSQHNDKQVKWGMAFQAWDDIFHCILFALCRIIAIDRPAGLALFYDLVITAQSVLKYSRPTHIFRKSCIILRIPSPCKRISKTYHTILTAHLYSSSG